MDYVVKSIALFIAVLPVIILGKYIYNKDTVEKEPIPLLLLLFLGGILSTLLTVLMSYTLFTYVPFFKIAKFKLNFIECFISVFFGIGMIEEMSKWIFTFVIAWNNKEFNHIYDAIVYCVFVSLGFACFENILYVLFANENIIRTALLRAFTAVPGHAFYGMLMGYYLGLSKLSYINKDKHRYRKYLLLSMFVPVLVHTLYDYILMVNVGIDETILTLFFNLYVVGLFLFAYSKIKKLSKVTVMMINNSNTEIFPVYGVFGSRKKRKEEKSVIEEHTSQINIGKGEV